MIQRGKYHLFHYSRNSSKTSLALYQVAQSC